MLMGGGAVTVVPEEHWPTFRRGVKAVFDRWTAIQLAVVNAWGGAVDRKVNEAEEEIAAWFASRKRKDELELEDLLIEILGDDFNVSCEDGSPREVAKALGRCTNSAREGTCDFVAQIESTPLPREAIERSKLIEEDRRWTMNGGGDMDTGDSSSDGEDDNMEEVDADGLADQLEALSAFETRAMIPPMCPRAEGRMSPTMTVGARCLRDDDLCVMKRRIHTRIEQSL